MVKYHDQHTHIASQCCDDVVQPSIKRWFKHSFYFKSSKRLFTAQQRQQLADAIQAAEQGHRGEIQVIIEASLPSDLAYDSSILNRARHLFAEYRIWDTEYNSGMLIYLNLCEHAVEIVTDRGIHQAVKPQIWDSICQEMLPFFKQAQFCEGLCFAIVQLGQYLQAFYQDDHNDPVGNELDNRPKFL